MRPMFVACLVLVLRADAGTGQTLAAISERLKPELVVPTGHADIVWSVAFSPDGRIWRIGHGSHRSD